MDFSGSDLLTYAVNSMLSLKGNLCGFFMFLKEKLERTSYSCSCFRTSTTGITVIMSEKKENQLH